jgi:hypothetical protein
MSVLQRTDIPGYDAEDAHGFGDCDALESWLDENGFKCTMERGVGQQRAWWSESAGLVVLTMPFWIRPENGEFRVLDAATETEADSLAREWWQE